MNRLLVLALSALLCFALGEAEEPLRKCMKCKFTLGSIPCYTTTETCELGEVCATIKGHAIGHQFITKKKCVEIEKCSTMEVTTYIGVSYNATYHCCEGDFCNSAAAGLARPSFLAAAVALMVSLVRFM